MSARRLIVNQKIPFVSRASFRCFEAWGGDTAGSKTTPFHREPRTPEHGFAAPTDLVLTSKRFRRKRSGENRDLREVAVLDEFHRTT